MVLTRNQLQSENATIDIFLDFDDMPVKKKIDFKGVERQRDMENKKENIKVNKKKKQK
jgi:hypothetical protein|tara:strand:+ start:3129 stop:3302 length:174 start_codon:yes stop_codon:yes gene_type:complete